MSQHPPRSIVRPPLLTALKCAACLGPTPLVEGTQTRCQYCNAVVQIPPEYQQLRAAEHVNADALARARAAFDRFGRPAAWPYRLLASSFSPGALAVMLVPGSPLLGLALMYGAATLLSVISRVNLLDVEPEALQIDAAFALGAAFVWVGALLGVTGTQRALALGPLQALMAATPPEREGGSSCCRNCGAPLTYGPRDYGVRCLYCRCDNLLRLPRGWVTRMRKRAGEVNAAVDAALDTLGAQWLEEQQRLAKTRWKYAAGLTLPTLAMFGLQALNDRGVVPERTWHDATTANQVLALTAERGGQFWYSAKKLLPAGDVRLQTTGPYCSSASGCRVYVLVPAQRAETWTVACTPADAQVFVEVHGPASSSLAALQSWQAGYPGEWGARVVSGTCRDGVQFEASRTGWHLVGVALAGEAVERPVTLSLRRAPR